MDARRWFRLNEPPEADVPISRTVSKGYSPDSGLNKVKRRGVGSRGEGVAVEEP